MNSLTKKIIAIVAVVVVLGAIGAILASHKSTSPSMASNTMASSQAAASSATATNAVSISNYMFAPMSIKVSIGTTVTWTNKDDVHHTVTANASGGFSSPQIAQNGTYSFKFTKAGTYTYYCSDHPYMKATVIVS
jgi:plastocyanin